MDIVESTELYEQWLANFIDLDQDALAKKHILMTENRLAFLRATYYRWVQQFAIVCSPIAAAPQVLAVGDAHLENFGTWRDAEGRLVWGVNDFDEAAKLPYTNDLARLALSVKLCLEMQEDTPSIDALGACEAIVEGYRDALSDAAEDVRLVMPIVLGESHGWLACIAADQAIDPEAYWASLTDGVLNGMPAGAKVACAILRGALPSGGSHLRWSERKAGEGSLGHPRITAIMDWHGGRIAREAKALAPSAARWANASSSRRIRYGKIVKRARRSPDPFLNLVVASDGTWVVRRLAPDCHRIDAAALKGKLEEKLFHAMGHELADIHLGQPERCREALDHLNALGPGCEWLHESVITASDALQADFEAWQTHMRG